MSTRANIRLFTPHGTFYYQINSSGYPDWVLPIIKKYKGDLTKAFNEGLSIGEVGNPSYYYDIESETGKVKIWDSTPRWVNAPKDWKQRGWMCYIGENGRYGYDTWIRGKRLKDEEASISLKPFQVSIDLSTEPVYSTKELKGFKLLREYLRPLKYDPEVIRHYIRVQDDIYKLFYETPYSDLALLITKIYYTAVLKWRLSIGK